MRRNGRVVRIGEQVSRRLDSVAVQVVWQSLELVVHVHLARVQAGVFHSLEQPS